MLTAQELALCHGCHGISDTEASALAPAVGQPSTSAGCLVFFAESQYHSMMRSDAEPEKTLPSPSTIVRRVVIQKTESGSKMTFKVFTVHQLSPYVNLLDIVIETQQCRLSQDWMCTRSSGPHRHVQSREYHNKTCGNEHGRPTNITLAQVKRDA